MLTTVGSYPPLCVIFPPFVLFLMFLAEYQPLDFPWLFPGLMIELAELLLSLHEAFRMLVSMLPSGLPGLQLV